MQKNSFILYTDILPRVERLSREQAGDLFLSVLRYAKTGEEETLDDPVVDVMYGFIADQIARHTEKYESICKRRSEYAKKRWNKLKQTDIGDTDNNRENEREHVRDRVPENKNDRVRVCERVRENELPPEAEAPAPAPQEETHTTPPTKSKEERIQEMLAGAETPSVYAIIGIAGILGYNWSGQEAQRFLDYNKTRNRKDNWEYAVRKWEEQRTCHRNTPGNLTDKERAEMEAYVSLGHSVQFPKPPQTDA